MAIIDMIGMLLFIFCVLWYPLNHFNKEYMSWYKKAEKFKDKDGI